MAYLSFVVQAVKTNTPWVVLGVNDYHRFSQRLSGDINVAEIQQTMANAVLGPEAAQKMATLASTLAATQDAGVCHVASVFWSYTTAGGGKSSWSIGPVVKNEAGIVTTSYALAYMSYTPGDWRHLFVKSSYDSFQLDISTLGLTFVMPAWLSVRTMVESKLGPALGTEIARAPIG
jgi:hypothetical protein